MAQDDRITVSKMAEIHKISRQTLIFYDKINLFRPALVEENGYRYYSYTQIPYLREICFLKSVGVKLEDIKDHIENRSTDSAIELLQRQNDLLSEKIANLTKMQRSVTHRIQLYSNAWKYEKSIYQPFVTRLPRRKVVFFPWGTEELTRQVLHLTLMKAWTLSEQYDAMPPSGWGAILRRDALGTGAPLAGAGAYVNFGGETMEEEDLPHLVTLEETEYACMYKYGMPYEVDGVNRLRQWIDDNGYEITGDIVDECLLDTTFYDEDMAVDFCQLQIPVRRRKDWKGKESACDECAERETGGGDQRGQRGDFGD